MIFIWLLLLVFVIYGNTMIWRAFAVSSYTHRRILPGMVYKVDGNTYEVPALHMDGKGYLLKENIISTERMLIRKFIDIAQRFNIIVWMSGGTLLGFIRHGTVIPWDDDCDFHTSFDNFKIIGSKEFQTELRKINLERIKVFTTSSSYASRIGAALRIRQIGTHYPVLDIFFVKHKNNLVCKLDSWGKGKFTFNKKERWNIDDIYPIQTMEIDHIMVPLPNHPNAVLEQQYGHTVLTSMKARDRWFSHTYPFKMFSFIMTTSSAV